MKVWSVSLSYMKAEQSPRPWRSHHHTYVAATSFEEALQKATEAMKPLGTEVRFECIKHLGELVS